MAKKELLWFTLPSLSTGEAMMGAYAETPIPPMLDCGVPAHYITGCTVEYVGNGILQIIYFRDEKVCGQFVRQVETKILLHWSVIYQARELVDDVVANIGREKPVLLT